MGKYDRPLFDTYTDYLATRHFMAGTIQGLQVDGIQYTEPGTVTTAAVFGTAFWGTVNPKSGGSILWAEFSLVAGLSGSNATADVTVQWRAKNKGGDTWVNLHPVFSSANINTTNVDRVWSGYFTPTVNFNVVPFEIQLLHYPSAEGNSIAKVKSTSYAKVCFESITPMTISA